MTKNEIIAKIIADMRAERTEADATKKALYYKALSNKDFAALDKTVRELTLKLARGKATEKDLRTAESKRDKMLSTIAGKTKTTTICPTCNNTGYVKSKLCSCVTKKYMAYMTAENILAHNVPKNFDNALTRFKNEKTRTEYKKIYDTLTKYCNAFPTPKNLVLSGATGTGKTYAAQIIANNLHDKNFSVLQLTAFSLIQRFKDYIGKFFTGDNSELDAMLTCDLLIIDDLGTEPVIKNVTEEYLYNVINERLTNKKPFIITTNLSPDDIAARYDQRLASRILSRENSVVIQMKSPDLRLN